MVLLQAAKTRTGNAAHKRQFVSISLSSYWLKYEMFVNNLLLSMLLVISFYRSKKKTFEKHSEYRLHKHRKRKDKTGLSAPIALKVVQLRPRVLRYSIIPGVNY